MQDERPPEIEEQEEPQMSKFDQNQANFMLEFAQNNYHKIMSKDGKQIKINGVFYNVTKIVEEVEDKFAELEQNLNKSLASLDPKKSRKATYEFITFATSATEENLKQCDRGELKNIALILGMIQKGFRNL